MVGGGWQLPLLSIIETYISHPLAFDVPSLPLFHSPFHSPSLSHSPFHSPSLLLSSSPSGACWWTTPRSGPVAPPLARRSCEGSTPGPPACPSSSPCSTTSGRSARCWPTAAAASSRASPRTPRACRWSCTTPRAGHRCTAGPTGPSLRWCTTPASCRPRQRAWTARPGTCSRRWRRWAGSPPRRRVCGRCW